MEVKLPVQEVRHKWGGRGGGLIVRLYGTSLWLQCVYVGLMYISMYMYAQSDILYSWKIWRELYLPDSAEKPFFIWQYAQAHTHTTHTHIQAHTKNWRILIW